MHAPPAIQRLPMQLRPILSRSNNEQGPVSNRVATSVRTGMRERSRSTSGPLARELPG